jgi:Family of unknown function (DUF5309)
MALLSGAGQSYYLGGATSVGRHNREDLQDFITNISPTETPFLSGIGQVDCKAVLHEFLTHSLAAASAANVVVEGNESAYSSPTQLTRNSNWTQINEKTVAVSGTQDAVNKAGMGRELAYRVLLHTKEIKRDMEAAALQNTAGDSTAGDATTARRIKGFEEWVTTNTSTVTTAPTQAAINAELQNVWSAGGNPDTLVVNGTNKSSISSLTTGVTKNLDANDRRLVTAVDVYESDFSIQRVVPDRFDNTQTIKMVESDLWKMAVLRPLRIKPLGDSGDTTKRLLNIEWTLECRQEAGNGMLNTA